jgi:hypothetical protein
MVVKAIQGRGAGGEDIVERLKVPDGEYATAHARDGAAIQIACGTCWIVICTRKADAVWVERGGFS